MKFYLVIFMMIIVAFVVLTYSSNDSVVSREADARTHNVAPGMQSLPIPGRVIVCISQEEERGDYFRMENRQIKTKYGQNVDLAPCN